MFKLVFIVFVSFIATMGALKPTISFSRTISNFDLQCKKCKYYKNDKTHTGRCMRFIKIHDKQHRLIAKHPSYVIEDFFYVPVEECRNNNTLCGEDAKEFVDKRMYWQ